MSKANRMRKFTILSYEYTTVSLQLSHNFAIVKQKELINIINQKD